MPAMNASKMDQQSLEVKISIEKTPRILHIPTRPDVKCHQHETTTDAEASDSALQGNCHSVPRTWPLFDDLEHYFTALSTHIIKAVGDVDKGPTPMERWQGETMLQSPWNNVSAVKDAGEIEKTEGGEAGTTDNGELIGEQWLTPMERWQSETVGQAPWNNVSAVGFGREEMDANGEDAKRDDVREIEGDYMSTVALGSSDGAGY